MIRVAILTSSRADYGIYKPLLDAMAIDNVFSFGLIVFGTHLSRFHGYTIGNIKRDKFPITAELETLILGDTEEATSNAIGNTITKFSSLWHRLKGEIDIIIALGDRYEMFAAVTASVPFNIPIAHIHGGETTLGAIDNKFRHAITQMSELHFSSTTQYAERIEAMVGETQEIYNVGALSLSGLSGLPLLNLSDFNTRFGIDIQIPTILCTVHSETVHLEKNAEYADTISEALEILSNHYQIVITMPNADPAGMIIRERFVKLIDKNNKIIGIENFGKIGYFTCMKHCSFLLGNTSSGIIEAASFGKFVINVGDRQKGRAASKNVIDLDFDLPAILAAVKKIEQSNFTFKGENIYYKEASSIAIIEGLKKWYAK